MNFKPGYRVEKDGWSRDGIVFSTTENLDAIKGVLAKSGPILVEHKFLRGGRSPNTVAFDDYEDFIAYLNSDAHAGDKITVWNLGPIMRDTKPLAHGKCPDTDGAVPQGGAY